MSETLSVTTLVPSSIESLGDYGERLAVDYLKSRGYRIVLTNFKVPVGRNSKGVARTGEIDIIAIDGETLCFVEVKTRRSQDFMPIVKAIDVRKRIQITRTARVYKMIFAIGQMATRFDAVTVLVPEKSEPSIELRKEFWTETTLRPRRRVYKDDIPF